MAYDSNLDIKKIKQLIQNIDQDVEILYQEGNMIPCIEKNLKQIKALMNLLKIGCMDIACEEPRRR